MDPLKTFIHCLLTDIEVFLDFVEDHGQPNYKYFNFVLNKLGIMHIFLYKAKIFNNKTYIMVKFVDQFLVALKKKFIEEKSDVKRAGIIFLIGKIYFTDEIAINLKLRIECEEWQIFKKYIRKISEDINYQTIALIFYQLYTENFFKFTMKTAIMALDQGLPTSCQSNTHDDCFTSSTSFWNSMKSDIRRLDHVNLNELKQLGDIREEAVKPFEELLPEKVPIDEVLVAFGELQSEIEKSKHSNKNVSKKEALQMYRDFVTKSSRKSSKVVDIFESDEDFDGLDLESMLMGKKKLKKTANKSVMNISMLSADKQNTSITASDSEQSEPSSSFT